MRILMSIHCYMDRNLGAPGATHALAAALRRRGHQVDVISYDDVPRLPMLEDERNIRYIFPWFVAGYAGRHNEYDILDFSSRDGWVFSLQRSFLRRKRRPVILARSHGLEHTYHEARLEACRAGDLRLSWKYPIYNGGFQLWESKISFAHADGSLFLNGRELRYGVERLGVDPSRALCVRNGIAEHFIDKAGALLASNDEAAVPQNVAFIGRYKTMKGSSHLRRAMSSVLTKYPKSRLGIFGSMLDENVILADFPAEVRDRISVSPYYNNDTLPRLLDGYHILAFPTLFEGFGIAPLEAMACGLVTIAASVPGPTSYIENGENGLTISLTQDQSLETAICSLFEQPATWRAMRNRALATALKYSWDGVAQETELIYARFAQSVKSLETDYRNPLTPGQRKSPRIGMD